MTPSAPLSCQLAGLELGDIVTMPPARSLTVRAVAAFAAPTASLDGFALLGECELLVASPVGVSHEHQVFLPVGTLAAAKGARLLLEGVASYWAPHLPSLTGAMGELPFRLIEVPGYTEPWILVYRGPEVLVFMRSYEIDEHGLQVLTMPRRSGADLVEIRRHAATVQPLPNQVPAPAAVPAAEPAHVGRR